MLSLVVYAHVSRLKHIIRRETCSINTVQVKAFGDTYYKTDKST